mmetsp:Transcript_41470/g.96988  ORF Transcript_41470/g.96988 Transcript_41470/m.96988 type:complete len:202 (+) Transcript_41470:1279-1884(+)
MGRRRARAHRWHESEQGAAQTLALDCGSQPARVPDASGQSGPAQVLTPDSLDSAQPARQIAARRLVLLGPRPARAHDRGARATDCSDTVRCGRPVRLRHLARCARVLPRQSLEQLPRQPLPQLPARRGGGARHVPALARLDRGGGQDGGRGSGAKGSEPLAAGEARGLRSAPRRHRPRRRAPGRDQPVPRHHLRTACAPVQ